MIRTCIILLSFMLSGCGLRPLYSGGSGGVVAQGLRGVGVDPIAGKSGWLVRSALTERLGSSAGNRYRLEVELDDRIEGFGVRSDDSITRERRTLRARYRLRDVAKGTVLLDATAGSDAGVDVVSSDYATIAAEDTAIERLSGVVADQIVARIARYVESTGQQ